METMKILARKGRINLVKYENGMYGVESITKGCSFGIKYAFDKHEIIDCFNEVIKTVKRSKNDINLEIYARS